MPHLFLLVSYASIAIVINAIDMLVCFRVMKETQDNFFFMVAMIQDGFIILYVLVGLFFAVWAFWGMPSPDKDAFITGFFVIVLLLAISSATVIVGLEDIIWRNPGEFIDLTWLFELVVLGYNILKWVIVLSYTISLAELGRSVPSVPEQVRPYELVSAQQFNERQFVQPAQYVQAEEPRKVYMMPMPMQMPVYSS